MSENKLIIMLEVREEIMKGKEEAFLDVSLIYYNNTLFLS